MVKTINKLPNNKSSGPDGIPYELIKYGGEAVETSLYTMLTKIFDTEELPIQWMDTTMVSLPKVKKNPEYMDNKRGLTLSNTTEKLMEKVILNRISTELPFTEAQAGARKGRSTTDQVFALKTLLNQRKSEGKTTYLAFLDIEKAYDKAWKAGVMLSLWRKGIRGKIWRIMKKLSEGIT